MNDFNNHLAGLNGADDFLAKGLLLNMGNKIFNHRQRDVGLKQSDADFAQSCVDILLGKHTARSYLIENRSYFIAQRFKHRIRRGRTSAALATGPNPRCFLLSCLCLVP